jgi:MaoC like domain
MSDRYLEDFAVGQTFGSGRLAVDEARIKSFAAEFDPQPFHLDEQAARSTMFRGLAASGWHTAAMTMQLLVESELKPAGGVVGAGGDELRWPRPVRPGDHRATFDNWGGHEGTMTRAMAKGLITGAAIGLLAGIAVAAGAESADGDDGLVRSILYALGELAVDTEMNAVRIEALSARVDELEARLDAPAALGK